MKSIVRIRTASDEEIPALGALFAECFADDAAFCWLCSQLGTRADRAPQAITAALRWHRAREGVVQLAEVDGSLAGAVAWRIHPDQTRTHRPFSSSLPWLRLSRRRVLRLARTARILANSAPEGPFALLDTIGITHAQRGRGIASGLIGRCLAVADRGGFPTYAETTTPNMPFLEHFGFELRDRVDLPDGPPVWTLLRPPSRPKLA